MLTSFSFEERITLCMAFYFFGFLFYAWDSVKEFMRPTPRRVNKFENIVKYRRFLFWQPVIWPLSILLLNPFHMLSEWIFKAYNDPNVSYGGFGGLRNFWKDLRLGKNRYAHYRCGVYSKQITLDAPFLAGKFKASEERLSRFRRLYVNLIYGIKEDKHLLSVVCCPEDLKNILSVSPYILDRSKCYSRESFLKALDTIDPKIKEDLARELELLY